MASVKTAISVDAALFKDVERVARKLRLSRSRFFAQAARDFLRRYHGRELLERINDAYKDGLDRDEERTLEAMRAYHGRAFKEAW